MKKSNNGINYEIYSTRPAREKASLFGWVRCNPQRKSPFSCLHTVLVLVIATVTDITNTILILVELPLIWLGHTIVAQVPKPIAILVLLLPIWHQLAAVLHVIEAITIIIIVTIVALAIMVRVHLEKKQLLCKVTYFYIFYCTYTFVQSCTL